MTRREVICALGAFAGTYTIPAPSLLGGAILRAPADSAPTELYDCIVLGAGVAGLTAAKLLRQWWGYKGRVLILEGSDRIGGRIQTVRDFLPGHPVELGAEYIHRSPGTVPLWDFVHAYRLGYQKIPKMMESRIFYPPHVRWEFKGGRRPPSAAFWWDLLEASQMYGKINHYRGADMAAAQWLEQYRSHCKGFLDFDRGLGADFVETALLGHMPGEIGDLSIRGFASDRISTQLEEKEEYVLSSGFDALVDHLAQGLTIERHAQVERISYGASGIEICTRDGREWRAKTAICTFSVGMLRSGQIEFNPALAPQKRESLEIIKPGHHSKVIIPFAHRFWRDTMTMAHYPYHGRRAGRSYFTLFYGDQHAPPTLSALLLGEDAARLDALPLHGALEAICSDLDVMFPHAAPIFNLIAKDSEGNLQATRKSWMQDPFALGGNSYLSARPDTHLDVTRARAALAESDTTPNLFWAGEAVALKTQPASVHGANASGIVAAKKVYQQLATAADKVTGPPRDEFLRNPPLSH